MIIFGSRVKEKEIGRGKFYCPNCGVKRRYKRKQAGKYFALYFIPLLQYENMGEFVECQTCGKMFPPDVLTYKPPSGLEEMLPDVKRDLQSGTPLHMAQRKLINKGVAEVEATQLVKLAVEGRPNRCPTCGLLYSSTVTLCANCGGPLSPLE